MRLACLLVLVLGCNHAVDDAAPLREVMIVPDVAATKLDVLFVIDNSTATLDYQLRFRQVLGAMFAQLPAGLDLHVGATTTDMGTSAIGTPPGEAIPGSVGGCSDVGMNGGLQTFGSTMISGSFVATAAPNYAGTFLDAVGSLVNAGADGCGFEQPLAAMRAATGSDAPLQNAGFVRDEADLAIVFIGDEDDCSLHDSALLEASETRFGPRQSFRCTRYGVTCDVGGATPDAMNMLGDKQGCHANPDGTLVASLDVFVDHVKQLKPDPAQIMIGEIIGDPSPVAVESRAPAGGVTAIPALAHSCTYIDRTNSPQAADPGVRLAEFAHAFPLRNVVETICQDDYTTPLVDIGVLANQMLGDTCVPQPLTAACTVVDGGVTIPPCTGGASDCWETVDDATCTHLSLRRTHAPDPAGFTHVSCPN